ncbi:MAG: hypothetical protein ACTSVY_10790 [Candidatus Helarchaeota archaeon]
MIRRFAERRKRKILTRFKDKKIFLVSIMANFFGIESKGHRQIRGNGVLILTEDELFFQLLLPKREYLIPISSMVKISKPKHHLKKIKFIRLLKITFKHNNVIDSAAWYLKNLDEWISTLEELTGLKTDSD